MAMDWICNRIFTEFDHRYRGVRNCTMDYGNLPDEYWEWFTHHDPRANVLNGPNGIYGRSENGNIINTGWNGIV